MFGASLVYNFTSICTLIESVPSESFFPPFPVVIKNQQINEEAVTLFAH